MVTVQASRHIKIYTRLNTRQNWNQRTKSNVELWWNTKARKIPVLWAIHCKVVGKIHDAESDVRKCKNMTQISRAHSSPCSETLLSERTNTDWRIWRVSSGAGMFPHHRSVRPIRGQTTPLHRAVERFDQSKRGRSTRVKDRQAERTKWNVHVYVFQLHAHIERAF